jgi:hypothetical protein
MSENRKLEVNNLMLEPEEILKKVLRWKMVARRPFYRTLVTFFVSQGGGK